MPDYGTFAMVNTGRMRVNNTMRPKTYTVVEGDTIYKIARKMYGDGALWQQIVEKNKTVLSNPCLLYPGLVLKV